MKRLLTTILVLSITSSCFSDEKLLIGILDHPQCNKNQEFNVRILFGKNKNEFIPIDNKSIADTFKTSNVNWIIAFDGKNRGSFKSYDPNPSFDGEWTYPRDKRHKFNSTEKILKIKSSSLFSGWCSSPMYRPVVIVSKENYKDPQKWKPFTPKRNILNQLYPTINKMLSDVVIVDPTTYKKEPFKYKAKHLTLFKSYKSLNNAKLIQVGLDVENVNCGDNVDQGCPSQWFYVKEKNIVYLGLNLELVDAGDYDNDGQSEIIFWQSGYNEDGYIMYYNDFKNSATFSWSYH